MVAVGSRSPLVAVFSHKKTRSTRMIDVSMSMVLVPEKDRLRVRVGRARIGVRIGVRASANLDRQGRRTIRLLIRGSLR